ncbi:hypothetical protein T09_9608 [Trichinella sp. T9]|uniref:Uncharacterized protein n=1 Tax=Trichinella murrelli TaxID=144512 RepID=A0A0V0THN3_9BILA|nr:hypothetical protein T05_15764 [Trichinella murrelli]KRX58538.1 hypothetical protein T09_9608 [Trichinella sp. T9]
MQRTFRHSRRVGHRLVVLSRVIIQSELTLRPTTLPGGRCVVNDLQDEHQIIISNVYYTVLLTATTKNHSTIDQSAKPHTTNLPRASELPYSATDCQV